MGVSFHFGKQKSKKKRDNLRNATLRNSNKEETRIFGIHKVSILTAWV